VKELTLVIKMMKNINIYHYLFIPVLILLTGCSLGVDGNEDTITQQDIEAIAQIIGESLSDENSGIVGSIDDALNTVSESGFNQPSGEVQAAGSHDENTGRGDETNINYIFDPSTGIHLFSFERNVLLADYQKEVLDTARYIYRDVSGNFIQFPAQNQSAIESIFYTGKREGDIITTDRNSFFVRQDTFQISGLSAPSGISEIDGVHRSRGSFSRFNENGQKLERNYSLEINFLNIGVEEVAAGQTGGLEQKVSGAFTYELEIRDPGSSGSSRTVRGSIDLAGDGTATLRLDQFPDFFQVNLDNGEIRNTSEEFEGQIASVNPQAKSFTLNSGIRVVIDTETRIDPGGDLFTLEAVQLALDEEDFVRAEGKGFVEGGRFNADEIKLEIDDDIDDENNDIDFDLPVESVDLENNIFRLANGTEIQIDGQTNIEEDGDFVTLEEVNQALIQGVRVFADGEARYVAAGQINFIADEVEFEAKSDDGDDDNDGEGTDSIKFNGLVEEVDTAQRRFSLRNGAVIQITGNTEIDGDFATLDEVQQAISQGTNIKAEGEGVEAGENQMVTLIASEVEFEVDNDEDNDEDND